MSLQINNNSSINTAALTSLFQKAGVSESKGVDDKPALVFTTRVDGTETQITINIPDDLELPDTVDQNAIDTFCAKLSASGATGVSDAEIEELRTALTDVLKNEGVSESTQNIGRSGSAMFDIYKVLQLLLECSQKQRDCTRLLRSVESQQIQTSILSQADTQRSSARNSMIASAVCCAVQIGAMGFSLYKQASSFKTQLSSLETSGVGSARQNLNMAQAGETADGAAKQLNSVRSSTDQSTVNRVESSFADADVATSRAQSLEVILNDDTAKLQRVQNLAQPLAEEDIPQGVTGDAIRDAQTGLAEFDELQQLKGQQNLGEAGTQRMNELEGKYNGTTREQLQTNLDTARGQYATELQQTVQTDKTALTEAQTAANTKINAVIDDYEKAYDTAVRERANVTSKTPKAEVRQLDSNLEKAASELKYARAYGANQRVSVTTAEQRQGVTAKAEVRLNEAQSLLKGDTSYIKAEQVLKRYEGINQVINAVGNCVQGMISNYNSMEQSEATEEGAVQAAKQEELEQIKDLFDAAGDLVDQCIELLGAINQAENQSMSDAIHV